MSACRSSPPPEELYREAEALRLTYEKAASEQAVEGFEAAALEWSRRKDPHGMARARERVGTTYAQLGLLRPSLRAYDAALDAARSSADPSLESEILSDRGIARSLVAVRERDFDLARSDCESALSLARRAGAGRPEARAHLCLGESAYNQGERTRALDAYRQSAAFASRVGDRHGEAEALAALGGGLLRPERVRAGGVVLLPGDPGVRRPRRHPKRGNRTRGRREDARAAR